MMRLHALVGALALLLMAACSVPQKEEFTVNNNAGANGDSTIYALVCEGSNDSVLVFLPDPYDGSDPDTLDILDAMRRRQVFGRLAIGDRVAMVRDTADSKAAAMVIVTQDLLGQWCYKVKPQWRKHLGEMTVGHGDSARMVTREMPDSVRQLLFAEREYGFTLKADSVALPVGMRMRNTEEDSPVEYPPLKRYRQWYLHNGKLMLVVNSIDTLGHATTLSTDTAELVMLTPDTLVLRMSDGLHGYYRKTE